MVLRTSLLWTVLLVGCATDSQPRWAFDVVDAEPVGESSFRALQTWELFADKWSRNQRKRHFVCAVLVELEGTEDGTPACEECTHSWRTTASILESDCGGEVAPSPFTDTLALGIGPAVSNDAPVEGRSLRGLIDYGYGWERHGDVFPSNPDSPGGADGWNDTRAFTWWPTAAWDLSDIGASDPAPEDAE